MKPNEFVEKLRQELIDEALMRYKIDLKHNVSDVPEEVWKNILSIYQNLSHKQSELFIEFIKIIIVNTISRFLGILDNRVYFTEPHENFLIFSESNNELLNGDLLELFWSIEGPY